ncbi:D-ribose pyranase [candidate division KSB1 bacterium]|nr:D-ribose pyranase [candidate division KSB1 bacterium]
MKKNGILNAHLSFIIASLGHTDKLLICDCGMPIPEHADKVDLALVKNIPDFLTTLKVVCNEVQIEQAIVANEMLEVQNGEFFQTVEEILPDVQIDRVSHDQLKQLIKNEDHIAVVRTGEATPFANIVLISGVTFP